MSLIFLTFFHRTFLVMSFGSPVTTRVLIAFGSVDPAGCRGCFASFFGTGSALGSGYTVSSAIICKK